MTLSPWNSVVLNGRPHSNRETLMRHLRLVPYFVAIFATTTPAHAQSSLPEQTLQLTMTGPVCRTLEGAEALSRVMVTEMGGSATDKVIAQIIDQETGGRCLYRGEVTYTIASKEDVRTSAVQGMFFTFFRVEVTGAYADIAGERVENRFSAPRTSYVVYLSAGAPKD